MIRYVLLSFLLGSALIGLAQPGPKEQPKIYRGTSDKINDLVHTKLDAHFDYAKAQLNGKVWITLKPHFYPTDSLMLDAKGMDIKTVALIKGNKQSSLKYTYNELQLNIRL